jgi:hypothetical protein
LDGLLRQDDLLPTAAWWAYKIYADGAESRVIGTSSNPLVAVLGSSQSDAKNKAQILIGYFRESQETPAKIDVSLYLKNLKSLLFIGDNSSVHIKIQRIRDTGEQAVKNTDFISEKDLRVSNNLSKLRLNKLSVNEAYLVTVTKTNIKRGKSSQTNFR